MRPPVALVVAKAPVPGEAKTRLGAVVGPQRAADVAAAAWLDTLAACVEAFGVDRCHLALSGDLDRAARSAELADAVRGWRVHEQRGDGLAERLLHAHHDVAVAAGAPVVQVGMDTPQLRPRHLVDSAGLLTGEDDAVLGPAVDGGWWLLGVAGLHLLGHLIDVPMSTPRTGELTHAALEAAGARVAETERLRDVDETADADAVAAQAPDTHFARAWRAVSSSSAD